MTDRTIELRLPMKTTILVFQSVEHPGEWIIDAMVEAVDVRTGTPAHFSTKWRGGEPTMQDVAQVVVNMLAHEVFEQLGLDPHKRREVVIPSAPRSP